MLSMPPWNEYDLLNNLLLSVGRSDKGCEVIYSLSSTVETIFKAGKKKMKFSKLILAIKEVLMQ